MNRLVQHKAINVNSTESNKNTNIRNGLTVVLAYLLYFYIPKLVTRHKLPTWFGFCWGFFGWFCGVGFFLFIQQADITGHNNKKIRKGNVACLIMPSIEG